MAEVFISYKKEDSASAERIAVALREEGFSVWWDNDLTPRTAWDATLEREISLAAVVVVLWTPRSVQSEWVRTEAHYGQDRSKLVPVLLENCELPIAFMLRQTVKLTDWQGDRMDRNWRKFLTWVADLARSKLAISDVPHDAAAAPQNPYRDVVDRLPSGAPVVDGAFVNVSTPAGTAFRDSTSLPVMRIVAKGEFLLGSPRSDPDHSSTEEPQRRVEIPRPFAIGVFPVLVSQYKVVVGEYPTVVADREEPAGLSRWFNRSTTPTRAAVIWDPGKPVTFVSYDDIEAFVKLLSSSTDECYRIPSEAEWEYACRAGSQSRYSCGDLIDSTHGVFGTTGGPVVPGAYPANAFGLYDMHGNVREWTADVWHESYDFTPLDGSPAAQGHSAMRVVRGGCWSDGAAILRSAARMRATPTSRVAMIGFRVVRDLV
jgi:formylglycine-generating enzyme required for sulfatase activity